MLNNQAIVWRSTSGSSNREKNTNSSVNNAERNLISFVYLPHLLRSVRIVRNDAVKQWKGQLFASTSYLCIQVILKSDSAIVEKWKGQLFWRGGKMRKLLKKVIYEKKRGITWTFEKENPSGMTSIDTILIFVCITIGCSMGVMVWQCDIDSMQNNNPTPRSKIMEFLSSEFDSVIHLI